jgi:hypothetical protein
MYPRRAVGAAGDGVDVSDLGGHRLVVALMVREVGLASQRGGSRRPDVQDSEDGLDPEPVAKLLHERHGRRRVGLKFCSEKYSPP